MQKTENDALADWITALAGSLQYDITEQGAEPPPFRTIEEMKRALETLEEKLRDSGEEQGA